MRKLRIPLLVLSFGLLACIDFDRQTMHMHYDADKDQLRIVQIYEGIHATGDDAAAIKVPKRKVKRKQPASPTAKEIDELRSVVEGQRTFFFSNWIFEYQRGQCDLELKGEGANKDSSDTPRQQLFKHELCTRLLEDVTVTNGAFYRNQAGELCGFQLVTVNRVKGLIALVNSGLSSLAREDPDGLGFSAQGQEKIKALVNSGQWVRLEGQELRIRYYDDYNDFIDFRDEMQAMLPGQHLVINYDEPIVEVIIGRPAETTVALRARGQGHPDRKLLKYVSKRYGLGKALDPVDLDRFLAEGRLPAPAASPASRPAGQDRAHKGR